MYKPAPLARRGFAQIIIKIFIVSFQENEHKAGTIQHWVYNPPQREYGPDIFGKTCGPNRAGGPVRRSVQKYPH